MSATFGSNNGANTLDLMLKHNWKNPQMPLEYVGKSDPFKEKMASFVQGIDVNEDSRSNPSPIPSTSAASSSSIVTSEGEPTKKKMKKDENENENEISIGGNVYKFTNCTGNINITINK